MKAFVITIDGHSESERASQVCIESSWKVKNEFSINRYEASTTNKCNRSDERI